MEGEEKDIAQFLATIQDRFRIAGEQDYTELYSLREIISIAEENFVFAEMEAGDVHRLMLELGFKTLVNSSGTFYMVNPRS